MPLSYQAGSPGVNGKREEHRVRVFHHGGTSTSSEESRTTIAELVQKALDFEAPLNSSSENVPDFSTSSSTPSTGPAREDSEETEDLFPAALLGMYSIPGLGRKGLIALDDLSGGLTGVWDNDSFVTATALQSAKIPDANRIADEIHARKQQLLEIGSVATEHLRVARHTTILPWKQLPGRLKMIPDAPKWLFVQGTPAAMYAPVAVAMVGTRKPTLAGLRATELLAEQLSAYPVTMISGLADGIDAEAHYATLNLQVSNIAFLGHGIDVEFPASTVELRRRIVEQGGAVATEYLPGERYQKQYFVQRNRLQAALSDLVIPIEAQSESGTAHTVRFAKQYGRRLVGVWWDGATGIISDLAKLGALIIDINTPRSRRDLDVILRDLAEEAGRKTYPLARAERGLMREFELRSIRADDVERLIAAIRASTPLQ